MCKDSEPWQALRRLLAKALAALHDGTGRAPGRRSVRSRPSSGTTGGRCLTTPRRFSSLCHTSLKGLDAPTEVFFNVSSSHPSPLKLGLSATGQSFFDLWYFAFLRHVLQKADPKRILKEDSCACDLSKRRSQERQVRQKKQDREGEEPSKGGVSGKAPARLRGTLEGKLQFRVVAACGKGAGLSSPSSVFS